MILRGHDQPCRSRGPGLGPAPHAGSSGGARRGSRVALGPDPRPAALGEDACPCSGNRAGSGITNRRPAARGPRYRIRAATASSAVRGRRRPVGLRPVRARGRSGTRALRGRPVTIAPCPTRASWRTGRATPSRAFASTASDAAEVLDDAVAIAAGYSRTPRDFDVDGPHVVTGPVFVEGAEPGDVLKIETLEATPRVPYGVVSSRPARSRPDAARRPAVRPRGSRSTR